MCLRQFFVEEPVTCGIFQNFALFSPTHVAVLDARPGPQRPIHDNHTTCILIARSWKFLVLGRGLTFDWLFPSSTPAAYTTLTLAG